MQTKRRISSKNKNTMQFIAIILFLIIILGATAIFSFDYFLSKKLGPVGEGDSVFIEIKENESLNELSESLAEQKLIQDALAFKILAQKTGKSNHIQVGYYEFNPTESASEILERMITGDVYNSSATIPEGKNIKEIGDILEKRGICKAADFIEETKNVEKYQKDYSILGSIPLEPKDGVSRTLEGYLFPDTYEFQRDGDVSQIVMVMLDRFVDIYNQEYLERTSEMGKTVDDIVTLASVIELETKFEEDKAPVASVFYNRMAQDMPLQSDITVDYARGEKTAILTIEQTQIASPYNTYMNTGLPFGPICSFGVLALKASLYPATTNYLYFVADIETGKTYFNETLEGHDRDVEKYLGSYGE